MFNYKDEEQDEAMMGDEKSAKIKLLDQLIDQLTGMGDDQKEDDVEMGPDMNKNPGDDDEQESKGMAIGIEVKPDLKDKLKGMM